MTSHLKFDFVIVCVDGSIPCVKSILSSKMEYFVGLFSHPMKETSEGKLILDDIDSATVQFVIDSCAIDSELNWSIMTSQQIANILILCDRWFYTELIQKFIQAPLNDHITIELIKYIPRLPLPTISHIVDFIQDGKGFSDKIGSRVSPSDMEILSKHMGESIEFLLIFVKWIVDEGSMIPILYPNQLNKIMSNINLEVIFATKSPLLKDILQYGCQVRHFSILQSLFTHAIPLISSGLKNDYDDLADLVTPIAEIDVPKITLGDVAKLGIPGTPLVDVRRLFIDYDNEGSNKLRYWCIELPVAKLTLRGKMGPVVNSPTGTGVNSSIWSYAYILCDSAELAILTQLEAHVKAQLKADSNILTKMNVHNINVDRMGPLISVKDGKNHALFLSTHTTGVNEIKFIDNCTKNEIDPKKLEDKLLITKILFRLSITKSHGILTWSRRLYRIYIHNYNEEEPSNENQSRIMRKFTQKKI